MKVNATILALIVWLSGQNAALGDVVKWCPPVQEWPTPTWGSPDTVPDGILVRVGSALLRSCTHPHSPSGERIVRLTINPAFLIERNISIDMSSLTVSDLNSIASWTENFLRNKVEIGVRKFGEARYREFDHHGITADDSGLSSFFVYDKALSESEFDFPQHYVSCPDRNRHKDRPVSCFIFVPYGDFIASITLIGGGPHFQALDRDDFPSIANSIREVLKMSDFGYHTSDPEWLSLSVE